MTRHEQARELCRQIRGFALNYPDGFTMICRQVDELRPKPATETAGPGGAEIRLDPSPTTPTTPDSEVTSQHTQQERRKPGRPKGSKNKQAGQ